MTPHLAVLIHPARFSSDRCSLNKWGDRFPAAAPATAIPAKFDKKLRRSIARRLLWSCLSCLSRSSPKEFPFEDLRKRECALHLSNKRPLYGGSGLMVFAD